MGAECARGRHVVGRTCLHQGDFIEAQANSIEALGIYDPKRNREARFHFGQDIGAPRGPTSPSQSGCSALIEDAVAHAIEPGHVPTLVNTSLSTPTSRWFAVMLELSGALRKLSRTGSWDLVSDAEK